jgi:hypothetical protein
MSHYQNKEAVMHDPVTYDIENLGMYNNATHEMMDALHFKLCHFNHPDMSRFNPIFEADLDNENFDYWADMINESCEMIYIRATIYVGDSNYSWEAS